MVCFCGICQHKVLTIIWSVSVADIKHKFGAIIRFVAVACQHIFLEILKSVSVAYVPMYFWKPHGLLLWHMSTHTSTNNMVCFCGRYQNIFLELLWSVSMAYVNTRF